MSLNKNLELAILLDNISVLNSLTYIFFENIASNIIFLLK